MKAKQYYLLLVASVTCVVALIYGANPQWLAQSVLGMDDIHVNFAHVLRAVMGLYFAFAVFWFMAAFSERHRSTAVLSTVVVPGGLAVGRLISLAVDGMPAGLLLFYTGAELVLFVFAIWIYRLPD